MKKGWFAVCLLAAFFIGANYYKSDEEVVPTYNEVVTIKEENNLKSSLDKIYNSVVVIETLNGSDNVIGTGSGFCYKKNDTSYIITNNHVIENGVSIKVVSLNEKSYDAKILGRDEYLDIAILSIENSSDITVATLSNSSSVELGDTVFTVGSPLGLKYIGTVTKGIISGKNRKVNVSTSNGNYIMDVLQTDAAINPGNSGGPLVNIKGEVIGINSLKLVQDEIEGMGFAIPIELVSEVLSDLEEGKTIIRPVLGIEISDNLSRDNKGVIVRNVVSSSIASKSGLKVGDIITNINNEIVEDSAHFRYLLYKYHIGDTISLEYIRNQTNYKIDITLTK